MGNKKFYEHINDKHSTPKEFYDKLDAEFHFDKFDPCPIGWKEGDPDGLLIDWKGKCIFVNPPYYQVSKWIRKGYAESLKGKVIVMLLRPDVSTAVFHDIILKYGKIRWIRGRLHFNGKQPPFASYLVIFGEQDKETAPIPPTNKLVGILGGIL